MTITSISAAVFIGVGRLIVHASGQYADAIRQTLSVFTLVPGLLATVGVTAEPCVAARTARQGSGSDASALSASAVPDDRTPAVAARRRGIERLSEHAAPCRNRSSITSTPLWPAGFWARRSGRPINAGNVGRRAAHRC